MLTAADLLRLAAARVLRGWTRDAYARDADGRVVGAAEPAAVCWCAIGAIMADAGPRTTEVLRLMGGSNWLVQHNDHVWASGDQAAAAMLAVADQAGP